MFGLEYDLSSVPLAESRLVSVDGDDWELALYAWLSELIWLHDSSGFVPGRFAVVVDALGPGGLSVSGTTTGAQLGPWFRQTGPQLKAVTMHGLSVSPDGSGYQATVYLDV